MWEDHVARGRIAWRRGRITWGQGAAARLVVARGRGRRAAVTAGSARARAREAAARQQRQDEARRGEGAVWAHLVESQVVVELQLVVEQLVAD